MCNENPVKCVLPGKHWEASPFGTVRDRARNSSGEGGCGGLKSARSEYLDLYWSSNVGGYRKIHRLKENVHTSTCGTIDPLWIWRLLDV